MEWEYRELYRVIEILRMASASFAQAELIGVRWGAERVYAYLTHDASGRVKQYGRAGTTDEDRLSILN